MRVGAKVRVRVPASTSNLGSGFDVFGLALGLYNDVELEILSGPGSDILEISGEGERSLPRDSSNMVLRVVRAHLTRRLVPNALRLCLTNRIPIARGLGSSAAARLGGALAVRALASKTMSRRGLSVFDEVRGLEGHPDNAAAALNGGLCLSVKDGGQIRVLRLSPPRQLGAVVCVPAFELPTEKAREVLPARVPLEDAVANVGRAAFLIHAIEKKEFRLLSTAMQDFLHQPYRRKLVPGLQNVIAAALKAGAYGAALSGAGPSVFAFAPKGRRAAVGRAMSRAFGRAGIKSRFLILDIDRKGATVEVFR